MNLYSLARVKCQNITTKGTISKIPSLRHFGLIFRSDLDLVFFKGFVLPQPYFQKWLGHFLGWDFVHLCRCYINRLLETYYSSEWWQKTLMTTPTCLLLVVRLRGKTERYFLQKKVRCPLTRWPSHLAHSCMPYVCIRYQDKLPWTGCSIPKPFLFISGGKMHEEYGVSKD